MSMISEQIKELREYGEKIIFAPKTRNVFIEAADTIESLSAKLQAANMERSADCGGWIYCGDGKNAPKKDGDYWITYTYESYKHSIKCVGTSAFKNGKFSRKGINIIAWMPCNTPEPYHEP